MGKNIDVDGRSSSKFQPLIERLQKKVRDWKRLALSHGRNSSIDVSICAFCFYFLLPTKIADNINKIFARFLWKKSYEKKPFFWRSREVIELPKGMGGLGIRFV